MQPPSPSIRFGRFTLELNTGQLKRSGRNVKLAPQPAKLLVLLASRAGQLVTREEIRHHLWTNETFVDFDKGLNFCIKQIRAALGDEAEHPTYIETLHRRGYRFIGHPETTSARDGQTQPTSLPINKTVPNQKSVSMVSQGILAVVAAVAIAVVVGWIVNMQFEHFLSGEVRSLAVLPVKNLSGNPDEEYFADGLTEALITELGKVHSLRVISHRSVMQFKNTTKTLPQIAKELNVDAVVEGSVLREGDTVSFTAQLLRVSPERHLWSESYERHLSGIGTLQRQVARTIVGEIKTTLTPRERELLRADRHVDTEAYDAYLRGLYHWSKRTPEALRRSGDYFERAIAKDSSYAPAYVSLAKFYQYSSEYGILTSEESLPKAKAAAIKAVSLDNSLAEGHAALAMAFVEDYNWQAAENEYQHALELNPGSAEAHYSYAIDFLSPLGRHTEAISQMERAQELDPLSPIVNANLGIVYLVAGQPDHAIHQCLRTLEITPNFSVAHIYLSFAYEQKGMYDESISELHNTLADSYIPQALAELARVYTLSGRTNEALEATKELVQLSTRAHVSPYDLARVYLARGEKDRALAELERAYDAHSTRLIWLGVDWSFNDLHSESRYKRLIDRMNISR